MSGKADAEAAARRATDEDAERLIADRKERQARRDAPSCSLRRSAPRWRPGCGSHRRYSRTWWAIPMRRSSYGATAGGRRRRLVFERNAYLLFCL